MHPKRPRKACLVNMCDLREAAAALNSLLDNLNHISIKRGFVACVADNTQSVLSDITHSQSMFLKYSEHVPADRHASRCARR